MPPWNPNIWLSQLMSIPILLIVLGFVLWFQHRQMQNKLEKRMKETSGFMVASRQSQEESKARAQEANARARESFAMQRRGLEIAEESMRDRQEMLALLQRIAEILDTRPRI